MVWVLPGSRWKTDVFPNDFPMRFLFFFILLCLFFFRSGYSLELMVSSAGLHVHRAFEAGGFVENALIGGKI